jgi:hypothetical protein
MEVAKEMSTWITVGELAESFAPHNNAPAPTAELTGKTLSFHFADGRIANYQFRTEHRLVWKITAGEGKGGNAEEIYTAFKIRENIYFVDYIAHLERATTVTLMLDLQSCLLTSVIGQLPAEADARQDLMGRILAGGEITSVKAALLSGSISRPFDAHTPRHQITEEMIGRRVQYTYSATECYEHIYLNANFYTWQCLRGSEKGLADTDRCHYYKLGEELYLFVWREKIIPTLGVVVVDYRALRSSGKIFGYKGNDCDRLENFYMGAYARLLNITRHD